MADLNGAGSGTLGGLSGSAGIAIHNWHVVIVGPTSGSSVPSVTPGLTVNQVAWDGGTAQVELQVSTDPAFGSTVHDSTTLQGSNINVVRVVTGLVSGTTYYARSRGGDGTYWGAWSATVKFLVNVDTGRGFAQQYVNIGALPVPTRTAFVEQYVNVGAFLVSVDNWPVYDYENIGVQITLVDNWPVYVYEGDVNTATPTPMIWFLKPSSGRENDGIGIVGWGFGDLASTYAGQVEIYMGASQGWVTVPITSWQTFPADANAYTDARVLDEINDVIDMQHTVIGILVPPGSVPPGYPIRVRTDGP